MSGLDLLTAFPLRSSLYPEQTDSQGLTLSGHCIVPDTKQPGRFTACTNPQSWSKKTNRMWMPPLLTVTRCMWPTDKGSSVRSKAACHTLGLFLNLSNYWFLHQHFHTVFTLPQCVEGRWSALIHHPNPAFLHFSSADHLSYLKYVTEQIKPQWTQWEWSKE